MSQDKIEITCSFCQAVLRVDQDHAGKRLRCPSCNNISNIPGGPQQQEPPKQKPSMLEPAFDDRPASHAAPGSGGSGNSGGGGLLKIGSSGRGDVIGLVTGIGGIVGNFVCGCLSPLVIVVCAWGLFRSYKSPDGHLKSTAITTNVIALAIAAVRGLLFWTMGF